MTAPARRHATEDVSDHDVRGHAHHRRLRVEEHPPHTDTARKQVAISPEAPVPMD